MNKHQLSNAYATLTKRFNLRAPQRDALDRSDDYLEILTLVHLGKWDDVEALMVENNYFNDTDPKFELVD